MKKCLTLILAATMALTVLSVCAFAREPTRDKDEDWQTYYDNQDIFTIKEITNTLAPGVDYYFEASWQGGPITDEFFEFYDVSVSVNTQDKDELSATSAKKMVDKAEFVKISGTDQYYFHFLAKSTSSYKDDADILVTVLAKDKSRDSSRLDSRSWYEMDLSIGYTDKDDPNEVTTSEYDVDIDKPVVEFDEDLKYCKLIFDDGSYYSAHFSKNRKFNLGHSIDANNAVVLTNPKAKLKFIAFYANPSFAYESVLKVHAPGAKYLYEIGGGNTLTLVSQDDGGSSYLGVSTSRLGAYVASDIPLDGTASSVSSGEFVNAANVGGTQTAPPQAASSVPAATQPTAPAVVITNPATGAAA